MSGRYKKLSDGSTWPMAITEGGDSLEWTLRYAPHALSRGDQLHLAWILSAYGHLIHAANRDKVALVRRELRLP